MLRMDQVHVIRHKVLREGASIRQVAHELGLSRNTVSKYLEQSAPVRRTYRRRERPGRWRQTKRGRSISFTTACSTGGGFARLPC
jgi:transposase